MPRNRLMALSPWFGGNRVRAGLAVKQFGELKDNGSPKWNALFVPFAGGISEPLVAPRCKTEVMNDLHLDILNLAQVLADPIARRKLRQWLRGIPMHERIHQKALSIISIPFSEPEFFHEGTCTDEKINRAGWYFIAVWQGMNGMAGTPSETRTPFSVRWKGNGGDSATRWVNVVQGLNLVGKRLEGMSFLCRDAFELIAKIRDDAKTVIYLDPPFDLAGGYIHDFAEGDHKRLFELLTRFRRARVVVRYYRTTQLADLYRGWRIVPTPGVKYMGNLGTHAPECLYLNQPPIDAPDLFEQGPSTPNEAYMIGSGTVLHSPLAHDLSVLPELSGSIRDVPNQLSLFGGSEVPVLSNP